MLRDLSQVQLHPSILPADFDITPSGELVLNLPPSPADSFQNGYEGEANGNVKTFKAGQVSSSGAANESANQNVSYFLQMTYSLLKCLKLLNC